MKRTLAVVAVTAAAVAGCSSSGSDQPSGLNGSITVDAASSLTDAFNTLKSQFQHAHPGATIAYSLRDFREQVQGRRTNLIPWLQDFSLGHPYGLIEVTDQIAAARRQHARGYMLWNPEGVYTRDALDG